MNKTDTNFYTELETLDAELRRMRLSPLEREIRLLAEKIKSDPRFQELLRGPKGKDIKAEDVAAILRNDKEFIEKLKGDSYTLTRQDKKDIAKQIDVPMVKEIRTIETVREKPITIEKIVQVPSIVDQAKITEEVEASIVNNLPSQGEKFRDGLELIEEEDQKLKISAVGYLSKRLDEIERKIKENKPFYVGVGNSTSSANFKENELLGTGDDSTIVFTLASTPVEGSVHLFVGGVRQLLTTDYSVSGATITFIIPPPKPLPITADYRI